GNNSATITLAFAIDNAGTISLNASTTSTNAIFAATVNEWDDPNVGSVTNASLFGKSFTLTGRASVSGSAANLAITELGGGGIGIQGENSNRVDGQDYTGGGVDKNTPEILTWTLNAPEGLALTFKSWSFIEGINGDIRVSNGTTDSDFANLAAATGTLALPGLPLANGEFLTFREIPGIGATTGAGISGFTFAVAAPSTAPEGFDNGSGNQLWTTATNWNPDRVPTAPASAIIDGYDVILNSAVANGPDALRHIDGSLTVTGSGALSMRSMTVGRDLEKNARLVIDGSAVSFGYSGSSAADEFAVGSAGTVETKPDAGGSRPLELGAAKLVLDLGSQWILDGSNASGPHQIGDRFTLANFGSFSGSTGGVRTRHFDLPADRRLELVVTATSIYYEVVAQSAPSGPNIIIINVDDMAEGMHFGFDGRDAITPTMDRLVSTGLYFNHAFATSTVCGPSRYSLLTGRYASRNTSPMFLSRYPLGTLGRFGVSDTELESDGQHLGAWLRQAGYRTGMVGKGHLIDDDLTQTSNWAAKGLQTYPQNADPKTDPVTNGKMRHNHRVLAQRMRSYGFDYVESYYKANLLELRNDALNVHNQEWITKGALDFIEENHNGRFFLYMAPTINHGPVRDDLTKTLVGTDPGYTSAGYLPDLDYSFMPTRQEIVNQVVTVGKKEMKSARETWLDYSIQAIINKLTQHGIRDDTLIIFTSDHGERTLTNNPLIWGKSSMFDLGMRTPLIMNWPNGIANPGRVYEELVSHVDLAPTLLALAGASGLPTRPVDGVSLVPVFNGSSSPVREEVFAELGYARAVRTKDRKYVAVRYTPDVYDLIEQGYLWERVEGNSATGEFTEPRPYYVNNRQLGSLAANTHPANTYFADDQIYDLNADPNEDNNLYGQDPAAAYDLKKRLASYIGSIPDRPFRQFSNASREFSPSPATAPAAPGAVRMQFLDPNAVRLNWSDAANSELGYVVRKTVNGGNPVIVGEYPSGTTSASVSLDAGTEDIVLELASYNTLGDSGVSEDLLVPESWRYRIFGDIDPTLSMAVSQWSNDADGDGVSTLWEYAYGTHPLLGSSVARPELRIGSGAGGPFLEYLLPRDRRRGLEFVGSVSTAFSSGWLSGPPHCVIVEDEENHLLFRSSAPVGELSRQFIRAGMVNPPGEQP
ncbi:MAG: sulfatase-like hydrolase/transferase, partial [Luteolibacter sp.]